MTFVAVVNLEGEGPEGGRPEAEAVAGIRMDMRTPEDAVGTKLADAEGRGDVQGVQDPEESGLAVAVVGALARPRLKNWVPGRSHAAVGRSYAPPFGPHVGVEGGGDLESPSAVTPVFCHACGRGREQGGEPYVLLVL